ncbi:hypothetical protein [Saccharopolyspora phatthalungensis]|uniref:Uncharacterized protein n=1 Tax=Saccharopolyspora phatthalungensis TaxID=664693 RepID=A0A840QIQ8_9PSEU|nr:hypothetical protein [Saccharopolyspora phatthalungensis]MBB5160050.1 hypothetical protein [Saccharopolyspora phatthalungensis]
MGAKISSESPINLGNLIFWVGVLMLVAWLHGGWYFGGMEEHNVPECVQPL